MEIYNYLTKIFSLKIIWYRKENCRTHMSKIFRTNINSTYCRMKGKKLRKEMCVVTINNRLERHY